MSPRQTVWPRTWLMTDERLGDRLWKAIDRLPEGSGIVFRHYALAHGERRALAEQVASISRERGFVLAVAADTQLAREVGADLVHNPREVLADLPFSRAVHSLQEAETVAREGAALVLISPVFATRSHQECRPLGIELATQLAKAALVPAIALGGMNERRFAQLEGFHGWAGIDAWLDGGEA